MCKYCRKSVPLLDYQNGPFTILMRVMLYQETLSIARDMKHGRQVWTKQIKYCPMCGRKLRSKKRV